MSAGALAAATTPVQKPFILRVGGFDVTDRTPVGDFPVHVSETTDGAAQMTFTIEDTSSRVYDLGAEVLLLDKRSGTRTLFGGHLVNMRTRRRPAGYGRLIDCTALGYDAWLDWRVITSWSSVNSKTGSRLDTDRKMVQQLVNKFGGKRVEAPDGTVSVTNTDMEKVVLKGVTLREALQRIADTATWSGDTANRYFYVDVDGRLHWFLDREDRTAPYRVADGHYTRTVLTTSGLVALWTMAERSGVTAFETVGGFHGVLTGGCQLGVESDFANEPQMAAMRLDGSTGYVRILSAAALNPGDTQSFECWFKRRTTGTTQYLWHGRNDGLYVRFSTTDKIVAGKVNGSAFWTSDDAVDDTDWHHLVVTKDGSTRRIYLDGTAMSSSGTNTTLSASGSLGSEIGATDSPGSFFAGELHHVAIYGAALSAGTVEAHYNQGVSIAPEDLVLEMDASDGREHVYVAGKNDLGSGWVLPGQLPGVSLRTAFGKDEPPRQELIEREDSTGPAKRRAYGSAFLKRHNDPQVSGSFSVTGFDGWRVGQKVFVTDSALSLDAYPIEIKQLETDVLLGNGTIRYEVSLGKTRRTASRNLSRSLPRKR